ncbi:hypothetical protein D3C71_1379530 [compost metagenome]
MRCPPHPPPVAPTHRSFAKAHAASWRNLEAQGHGFAGRPSGPCKYLWCPRPEWLQPMQCCAPESWLHQALALALTIPVPVPASVQVQVQVQVKMTPVQIHPDQHSHAQAPNSSLISRLQTNNHESSTAARTCPLAHLASTPIARSHPAALRRRDAQILTACTPPWFD